MNKQRYPLGRQTFEIIIKEGSVYVDKTDLIYDLVHSYPVVFLARPRRFGKSLLLSTIESYFEGEKELFTGLKICEHEKDWNKFPVFHLDLSTTDAGDPSSLKSIINGQFERWENLYNLKKEDKSLSERFNSLIIKAYETAGEKVVILIDEYDNPLINTIHLPEIHEANRNLLKSLYSYLKANDKYIRFAMLTGVSRFSRTTIFSGLNNLTDITFLDKYSSICGFTEDEIRDYMWPGIVSLGRQLMITPQEALHELKREYDGYHFSKNCKDIYNPYSMIYALDHQEIADYWLLSGAPGFLIEKLRESSQSFFRIFNDSTSEQGLAANDTAFSSPVALMYQTGYLTIKGYDPATRKYKLGIPNREVEEGLFPALLGGFTRQDAYYAQDLAREMGNCLKEGNPEEFMLRLKSFLASDPYNVHGKIDELFFEHTLYLLFRTIPLEVTAESPTSFGRRDLIVMTDRYIYIFELKIDRSAKEAIDQINNRNYALPHLFDGKTIIKIGINFSSKTRTVDEWIIQTD